jgi:EAL domain-containing protein (putative c-di-GMP-specific phosphodiesterase class I)
MDGGDAERLQPMEERESAGPGSADEYAVDDRAPDPAAEITHLAARLMRLQSTMLAASDGGEQHGARHAAVRSGIEVLRGFGVSLLRELQEALARDAFHYVYQPIVSVATGDIAGYEALIRWRRGSEIVTPGLFLPIAEETSLIAAIQQHLIRDLAAVYAQLDPATFIAINWAPSQLADPTAIAALIGHAQDLKLEPDRIVIEITERSALVDPRLVRAHVDRLKEHGFRVALDDFGSGCCSFAFLARLPLDLLKIDGSLIRGAERCERAAIVLRGVLAVARELGHKAVAEGVESGAQLALLRQLGCELAQGYFIGHPARELASPSAQRTSR